MRPTRCGVTVRGAGLLGQGNPSFLRRPLVGLVLTYAVATGLGYRFGQAPSIPLIAALGLLGAAAFLLLFERKVSRYSRYPLPLYGASVTGLLHLCVFSLAWAAACRPASLHPCVEGAGMRRGGQVVVSGMVVSDVDVRPAASEHIVVSRFLFRVEDVCEGESAGLLSDERVDVIGCAPEARFHPRYGERWVLAAQYKPSRKKRPGSSGVLVVQARKSRRESREHGFGPAAACFDARRKAADRLAVGIRDRRVELGVLRAILLGYRSHLDTQTRETFALCGALHIFAISGLHVGIISLLIIFVLGAFKVPRMHWALYLTPLLGVYVFITGGRASAVRAWLMATFYFAAPLFRRRSDALSSVAMAALIILICKPGELFDIGFIYSFTVVLGLIAWYPVFERRMRRWWRKDPLRLQPEAWWERTSRTVRRSLCSWIALSAAAWLASAPLTLLFFGRFIVGALLGNIVVVPLAFLIVTCGCLSLVLGPCVALGGEIFNHSALALIVLLTRIMRILGAVPCLCTEAPKPPVWAVAALYAVMGAVFLNMMDSRSEEWNN